MYMSEISKSKVSGLKAQKKIILWTLKHVSAISEHPVLYGEQVIIKYDTWIRLSMKCPTKISSPHL